MTEREHLDHEKTEPISEPLQPDPYLREGPVNAWASGRPQSRSRSSSAW